MPIFQRALSTCAPTPWSSNAARKRISSWATSPCLPGASAQGATEEELLANLREVLALLFADGEPPTAGEFVGTRTLTLGDP